MKCHRHEAVTEVEAWMRVRVRLGEAGFDMGDVIQVEKGRFCDG